MLGPGPHSPVGTPAGLQWARGGLPRGGNRVPASLAKLCPPWNQERGGQMECEQAAGGDSSGRESRLPSGLCPYLLGRDSLSRNPVVTAHFLDSLPRPMPKFKEKPVSPGPSLAHGR